MKNKKILIVGGCGFIGHNLALLLKKNKYEIVIVDSLSVNNLNAKDKTDIKNKYLYDSILNTRIKLIEENHISLIIHDTRENKSTQELFKSINPDIVIHLAAVSHANKSNKDPHTTFDNSLRTLENSLDYVKDLKKHVIFLSSSMVYGNFNNKEVDEKTVCDPIGIYGNLKLSAERMIKSYNKVFDVPYTIIRPSALYGERCVSRRVGQIFIENAIQNLDIEINGDGEEKLDFTYIQDLIEGIKICCKDDNAINETFNITFGNARKINDLINLLKLKFENVNVIYKNKEKFMPERGTLNIEKAKTKLNFSPRYSIEDGYVKYIDWYKQFWNLIQK